MKNATSRKRCNVVLSLCNVRTCGYMLYGIYSRKNRNFYISPRDHYVTTL